MTDGLKAEYRTAIIDILAANERVERVVLFGSRAMETFTPASDVDIALFGDHLTLTDQANLAAAIEELPMAQRVDLLLHKTVNNEALRKHIEQHGVEWYRRRAREGSGMASEWDATPLSDLAEIYDGPHATPKKTADGPVFLGISNLDNGRLNLSQTNHLSEEDFERWTRRVTPQKDDIVFSYETRLGEAAQIPQNLRCCLGRRMGLLRPKTDKIDARFLLYAYLGPRFQETLRSRTIHGSTVDRIPLTEMGSFPIDIPRDINEQRAIAHILGTLDDKIECNRRMNETLEDMARTLFQSWFIDFDSVHAKAALFPDRFVDSELGKIPEGWEVKALPEAIDINPTRSLRKGAVAPYLDMANMPTKGHTPDTVIERPFGSGTRFTNGDTLVARITPCLENGKTAYVDFLEEDTIGWGSTEYIVMRPKPPLPDEFAYCLARSAGFREFAIQSMTGSSGRQRVPVSALSNYRLPLPSGSKVLEVFGEIVQPFFLLASRNAEQSRTLAALRDTLLPKLVSGDVRVGM